MIINHIDYGNRSLEDIMAEISPEDLEFRAVYEPLGETVVHPVTGERTYATYFDKILFVRTQYDDIYIARFHVGRFDEEIYNENPCILLVIGQFRMAFKYDMHYADKERSHLTWEILNAGERLGRHLRSDKVEKEWGLRINRPSIPTAYKFENKQQQDYVLKVLELGLSNFNHDVESRLEWPDGREVTKSEWLDTVVYKSDGAVDRDKTREKRDQFYKDYDWKTVSHVKKLGGSDVIFTYKINNGTN